MSEEITAELLLAAYASGYFPMAESKEDPEIYWFYPEKRGIIPLDAFKIPRSLTKVLRDSPFTVTGDKAFPEVIRGCSRRDETWINERIIGLYIELWQMGYAHSVECWRGKKLVGGLYGVALGGAFFGESMFSREPNASKVALVHLVNMLKTSGYTLLDAQYVNEHLKQFGVIEITRDEYLRKLEAALKIKPA